MHRVRRQRLHGRERIGGVLAHVKIGTLQRYSESRYGRRSDLRQRYCRFGTGIILVSEGCDERWDDVWTGRVE